MLQHWEKSANVGEIRNPASQPRELRPAKPPVPPSPAVQATRGTQGTSQPYLTGASGETGRDEGKEQSRSPVKPHVSAAIQKTAL